MLHRKQGMLASLMLAAPVIALLLGTSGCFLPSAKAPDAGRDGYLFCFWNTENLFDDQNDHRKGPDKTYDAWFAENAQVRQEKYDHLSKALVGLNGGQGPDILAVAEVESVRAAELLRDALNQRLDEQHVDPSLHYQNVLMKEVSGGRHIAPAIITRLPVERDRTRMLNKRLRMLEGHVVVDGHDLVVLATHWTSRLSDRTEAHKKGTGREKYAKQAYGRFRAMYTRNPRVDFLMCGDFNDPPTAPTVTEYLHATGDREKVLHSPAEPLLLDLMIGKDPNEFGTHNYHGKWFIFDQILVAPGLLDQEGWSCDVDSVKTINTLFRPGDKKRRPWAFGNPRGNPNRGYSDHFPVTVRLRVSP